jgi:hypothetical protein
MSDRSRPAGSIPDTRRLPPRLVDPARLRVDRGHIEIGAIHRLQRVQRMPRQCLVQDPERFGGLVAVSELEVGDLHRCADVVCRQPACFTLGHLVSPMARGLRQATLRLRDRREHPAGPGLPLQTALLLAAQLQRDLLGGLTVPLGHREQYSELQSCRRVWRQGLLRPRHRAPCRLEPALSHLGVQQLEEVLLRGADS